MNRNPPLLPTVVYLLILGFSVCLTCSCSRESTSGSDETGDGFSDRIIVQLDWVAEPEHGGFYQAEALGFFEDEGLDVDLIQGGPNAFVHQKIATGQAQFGQSDSTNTLLAIAEGLPLINVAAVFQHDPSVLMLHEGNPISSFEELEGKTIMARPEWVFLAFLRQKYGIEFNVLPQNFGLAQFLADPGFIQQGFYIAEPFFIEREGITPKYLYAWDSGFDAYTVIIGNRDFVRRFPEVTRAFLRAYIRGYRSYLTEDPEPAHDIMLRINPKVSDEYLGYSRRMIISEELATGPNGNIDAIGWISRERFSTQIDQLEDLGILKKGAVSVDQVMSDHFLPH
ncbi:MAG: myristoyl transferase [Verrucomicrobia bacterium]|nr:MAG: myristoyl transferase [Verrucomicrobiota bacterium]